MAYAFGPIGASVAAGGRPRPEPPSAVREPGDRPGSEVLALTRDLRVRLLSGRDLVLEAKPWPGEEIRAMASRLAGTPVKADLLAASLADHAARTGDGYYRAPLPMLADTYRALVLRNVFPEDTQDGADWIHVARVSPLPIFDEGLWQVALWFTGSGSRFEELQTANHLASPELSAGQRVRIPAALLDVALRAVAAPSDGALVFGSDAQGDYAGYRLQAGEALYSAVVLRFTGRTSPDDVESLARQIAGRSGIRDLTDIPSGWLIKIPRDLLEPEFLPRTDPRRKNLEKDAAAMAEELLVRPPRDGRKGLKGVVVILDPGHGGLDPGTASHGIWEHDYVFDVASRLKRELEDRTGATVYLTLDDPATGAVPSDGDALEPNHRRTVLTTPPFLAVDGGETAVAVNLRWYLANSIFRRQVKAGADPDRIVFVSLHADARHPSLRGAMVYVPGARYREGSIGFGSATYRRFREVREESRVSFTRRDRLRSEAVSRKLAGALVKELRKGDLPVQPYEPVRERVIRGNDVWLPAVLKGNEVPAKVLVEMVNLNNPEDASLLGRDSDRQRLARALAAGLATYFGRGAPSQPAAVAAGGANGQ